MSAARDALDAYARVHFLGTGARPEGVAYTYASRLRTMGDDQIARCIETLRADPEQRRAAAVTWDVGHAGVPMDDQWRDTNELQRKSDAAGKNPPCLTHLWFRRDEDGTLYTHATFRSHDLLQAGVPNAWGLCRLAEHVAGELGWPVGKLTITSLSGHVYEQGWAQAEQIAQERGRVAAYEEDDRAILRVRRVDAGCIHNWQAEGNHHRCATCNLWHSATPGLEVPPRATEHGVAVDLLLPSGATVDTVEGRTAEGVEREVLERGWITVPSHAAWLGRTLAQAGARDR